MNVNIECKFAIDEVVFGTTATYLKVCGVLRKIAFRYYPVPYLVKDIRLNENSIEYLCEAEDKSRCWIKEDELNKAVFEGRCINDTRRTD